MTDSAEAGVGREGETGYLAMEYLEGETLSERLAKGALSLKQIAEALDRRSYFSARH